MIPIRFEGFTLREIENIWVLRKDNIDPNLIDTFLLSGILWAHEARTFDEQITDKSQTAKTYGDYESYFDNCDLVLVWETGKDSLMNMQVKKSQEKVKGCYKNHPNIQIDHFSFMHKGKNISKGEEIIISK